MLCPFYQVLRCSSQFYDYMNYLYLSRLPQRRTGLKKSCRNTATRSFLMSMTSKLPPIRGWERIIGGHWEIWNLGIGIIRILSNHDIPCTTKLGHRRREKTESKVLTPAASRATSLGHFSSISGSKFSKGFLFNLDDLVPGPGHTCHAGWTSGPHADAKKM